MAQPEPGAYHGVSNSMDGAGTVARDLLFQFLNEYREPGSDDAEPPYYHNAFEQMKQQDSTTMVVEFSHMMEFHADFANRVCDHFVRLEPFLRQGVQQFVHQTDAAYTVYDDGESKEFYISIQNLPHVERLRDLRTGKLGKLVAFSGTVTRTTEVRPELFLGAFRCGECGVIIRGVEQQFRYTTPIICTGDKCGNRTKWTLEREDSVFLDWQRVRVQENTDEVPAGSLPRTVEVIVRGQCVEVAKPGDKMVFTGALIVVPDVSAIRVPGERTQLKPSSKGPAGIGDGVTGIKNTGMQELTYRTAFLSTSLQEEDNRGGMVNIRAEDEAGHQGPEAVLEGYDAEAQREVLQMAAERNILGRLTASLAPGVWGSNDIKQAILLMLLGGVPKTTYEGINLRGDINIAIIGDPACAKSQLLKYVAAFLPRAIYTSGKASTAAGLTATVVKDADNGEFCIEAGALMLADNGICCIDEFDKMDVKDQVAIHEAMEQQTISIAKAGINATLNARASILAAANPIGGRYDRTRTLRQNIMLPPAILSRFDLLHVMLDEPNEALDLRIASHILSVHRNREGAFTQIPYTTEQLQRYIKYARSIRPMVTPESKVRLVAAYKELRGEDAAPGTQSSYRITVRQLEALVRLSEAIARAHCQPLVLPAHVAEAKRLLRSSVLRVEVGELDLDDDPLAPPAPPPGTTQAEMDEAQRQAAGADDEMPDASEGGNENDAAAANRMPGAPEAPKPSERSALRTAREAVAAAGGAGPSGAQADGQATAEAEGSKKTRVDAKKFQFVKNLLVRRLREQELQALTAAAQQETEMEVDGPQESMGLRQADLVNWYLTHEINRGVLKGEEQVEAEFTLVEKIINHLLKREGVMVVIHRPERTGAETPAEYLTRLLEERVLGLHPNFDPDA